MLQTIVEELRVHSQLRYWNCRMWERWCVQFDQTRVEMKEWVSKCRNIIMCLKCHKMERFSCYWRYTSWGTLCFFSWSLNGAGVYCPWLTYVSMYVGVWHIWHQPIFSHWWQGNNTPTSQSVMRAAWVLLCRAPWLLASCQWLQHTSWRGVAPQLVKSKKGKEQCVCMPACTSVRTVWVDQ